MTGLKENADLALLDGKGKIIVQSRKPGKKAETITTVLGGGTFYLQVKSHTSQISTPYQLSLSATPQMNGGGNGSGGGNSGSGSGGGNSGGSGSGGGNSGSGITTQLIPIPATDTRAGSFISGDTVFSLDYTGSSYNLDLSAYSNGSTKHLGTLVYPDLTLAGYVGYGNRAVWFSKLSTVGDELFLYDGTTTKRITNSVSDTPEYLGMDGSRVFWSNEKQDGTIDLYAYNGTQNVLLGANVDRDSIKVLQGQYQGAYSQQGSPFKSNPSSTNTSLVWEARGGSDGGNDEELFLYNGDNGKVIQLTANDSDDDGFLDNSGTNILFKSDGKISFYKSAVGQTNILGDYGTILSSGVSGENVLFYRNLFQNTSSPSTYFLYNGSTVKQITNPGDQITTTPTLSGSNVVFSKRDGATDSELFFYNGKTGQTTQLTQRPGIDPPNLESEQELYQNDSNVFWNDSSGFYVSNGDTGERKKLADSFYKVAFINANALWEKDGYLFLYNGSTGETSKLEESYNNKFFAYDNINQSNWLSGSYIGWGTDDGKTFLYNTATKTTTQLTGQGYSLEGISGSHALVIRNSDGAYFYTDS